VTENERQQRMIERVQEDERLRGDLPDAAATALVEWAGKRVAAAAADPQRPDAEVEAEVQTIRAAARAAARAGEEDVQRLLAVAEAELAQRVEPTPQTAAAPAAAHTADLAAARAQTSDSARPADTPLPPAPSEAQAPRPEQPRSRRRHWNPFAGFWSRIRGGR
jgi:hypothetical protein